MQAKVLLGTTKGLYEIDSTHPVQFAGHEVRALAHDGAHWWTIVDGRELWRSDADGVVIRIAALETAKANCLLPTPAGLLVGTVEAHLLALHGDTLMPVRSFDTAPGRETWHTPWGAPPAVRSMAADPSGPLYVNVHVGGVARSTDNGKSWTPTIDVHADVHEVRVDPTAGLVLAASARGLAVSDDQGGSWRFETGGLHGRYSRAVSVAGGTILLTASTGPYTKRAAVYRKPVHSDEPFERCQQGLPEWFSENIDTACLAASDSWAVFGTSAGEVFLSADEGQSWRMLAEGLPPVRCVALM
ncbi:MAG TPA: sialidase family protein [Candidatus Binatia bacterium]|jgi:hypothetical protein|nr:sialidase family protein [Candidatus Binatia bacterium]